jgi:hypothetical protein
MDYGYEWKKGDFVRHDTKGDEWGVGIVTQDQRETTVPVFFEHECQVRKLGGDRLVRLEDPGTAATYLRHALVDEEGAGKYDREPFPTTLNRYLEDFPMGFQGEIHLKNERDYKVEASDWAQEHFAEDKFAALLETDNMDELGSEIRRLYSKTNLLASFEMIKLGDAMKQPEIVREVGQSLYKLLYDKGSLRDRFESAARVLEKYELGKWPIITYPLFMLFPDKYMFLKPAATKEIAFKRGFDIKYDSKLNWETYSRVLELAADLRERLTADKSEFLHPRDLIDVQSFMWCAYSGGWSAEEKKSAKDETS